ncbi:hypothetical protein HIM_00100 [Hirsutella minnesotensis 3608]|nr:hypothetical protein HIM_00100 [Hirsutella minnesotensis 3608]
MPTTRRSTGNARARSGPTRGQSTISFSGRVTKSIPSDAKKAVLAPSGAKIAEPAKASLPTEEAETIEVEEPEVTEEPEPEELQEEAPQRPEAEIRAEKISDAQIKKYWKSVESQRKAPRVHQEDLDVSEKVLRYFDVSSQYGPCIGITRMKRWHRANRLGLSPPIEVLAVLLKEGAKDTGGVETAQMDKILNSIAVSG